MLSLGELEGRRSTRDQRSLAELKGEQASEGAARPPARFNSVPLTDTGHERQHKEASNPQLPGFVFRLLVPSIILVLLAVGGLLFYRRRRRPPGPGEGQTGGAASVDRILSWAHRTVSPWEEILWGRPLPPLPNYSPGNVACPP